MGLGTNEKRLFLKLKDGKVVASDGRVADYIEGFITGVAVVVRTFNGEPVEMVNFTFTSAGEDFILGMNKGTGITRALLNHLCSADTLGVVRVTPYVKDGWQRVVVTNNSDTLRWKHDVPADADGRAARVDGMLETVKHLVEHAQWTPPKDEAKHGPAPNRHKRGEPQSMPF